MLETGHEQGVAHRAFHRHRDHAARRGVSGRHAALRGARLADHGPDGGRRGGSGLVPAHLPHREEDRARMVAVTSSVIRRRLSVLALGALALAGPLAGQTSLSIYSDGRVVVRRTLPQALEKGCNTAALKLEGLDP